MKLLAASLGILFAAFLTVALLGQDLVYQCPMDLGYPLENRGRLLPLRHETQGRHSRAD